jgi:hypothetical protein
MTRFAKFIEAFQSARQLEADRVIRRYGYLVSQARAHQEKEKLQKPGKNVAGASSQPSFIAGTPLCSS